jgi:catecholate siderophore receptor
MTASASSELEVSGATEGKSFIVSKVAWARASIGIAAAMLISESSHAQTVSCSDELPQIRVTAP